MDNLRTYCSRCNQLDTPLTYVSHTINGTAYGHCSDCITKSCVDCGKSHPISDMRKGHSLTGVEDIDNYICIPCDDKARDEEE